MSDHNPELTVRQQHLSSRLLRYSAVASLTAATSLLLSPSILHADSSVRDMGGCDALNDPLCVIDFDDPTGSTPEFIFTSSVISYPVWGVANMMVGQSHAGDAGVDFIYSNQTGYAAVLPYGAPIGDNANWANSYWANLEGMLIGGPSAGSFGNWQGTHGHATDPIQGAYIGVKFVLDGTDTHYGWIEVYKTGTGNFYIQRIGYDTTPGTGIPATVDLASSSAISGLRGVIAGALTAIASVFTWLRRKTFRS